MTPAEFKAERSARVPWSVERTREELAKAIADADRTNELGVHVCLPVHSFDAAKTLAMSGGWCASGPHGKSPDGRLIRLDLSPGGPADRVNLGFYRGGATSLPTAAEHRDRVEVRRPLSAAAVARLVDGAIAEALLCDADVLPGLTVRVHSLQAVVDRAAADGWNAYAFADGLVLRSVAHLQPTDFVNVRLTGDRLGWMDQDEWIEHEPLPPISLDMPRPT